MAKIILVRHGQTNWCKEGRIRGIVDIPLNTEGKMEAQKIAGELSKFKIDAVYSAHATCSSSTADEIAVSHKLKAKKISGLNELNLGLWQGLLVKDIKKRYGKHYAVWRASPASGHPPGGEPAKDAYDRIVSAMHKLADRHKDGNICLVSGGLTLAMAKCHLENANFEKIWKSIPKKAWWEALELSAWKKA